VSLVSKLSFVLRRIVQSQILLISRTRKLNPKIKIKKLRIGLLNKNPKMPNKDVPNRIKEQKLKSREPKRIWK
jgi:hypothetical protein